MTYLVDASVWLETLLKQAAAAEADAFLRVTPGNELAISQFAVYSIGIILTRRGFGDLYALFLRDLIVASGVAVLALSLDELADHPAQCARLGLDFDDAYQYRTAEASGLTLVSFDAHFDRTPRGRKAPAAAMPANP